MNMRGKKYNTVDAKAKGMDGIAYDGKVRMVSDLNRSAPCRCLKENVDTVYAHGSVKYPPWVASM